MLTISIVSFSQTSGLGVTDIDGNTYPTVIIGNQEWMAENLKVSKFQNGDPIPNLIDGSLWQGTTSAAYCVYNNDSALENIYGKLYNWYTASDNRNVCPSGWRVPNENDFNQLITFLDPSANNNIIGTISQTAGGYLKDTALLFWGSPNTGATNSTGFSALPAGFRDFSFYYIGFDCFFWTSTSYNSTEAWYRGLNHSFASVSRYNVDKNFGKSIRCINTCVNTSSQINETGCGTYTAPDGQIYTQSGTYNATIPNATGCDSLITINLTIQNVDTGVSLNVNTLTSNETGAQYQWIDCATNQQIANATQQSFTPTLSGNFAVVVINGNCSDTSSCTSVLQVSIDEKTSNTLSVQPNPTSGIINIYGLKPYAQNKVILYSISGEKMSELIAFESEIEMNLDKYAPGMYLLKFDGVVLRIIKR